MKDFFYKYRFWFNCWVIIFSVISLVFSFYMITFFLGDHDWQFMRYGMPLGSGLWEARLTQFIVPFVLTIGQILPVLNVLLGFLFFSGAAILLARWYELPQKYSVILIFSLLIVLHPFVCAQFYYVHLVLSILTWHLCCVAGVICLWQFIDSKRLNRLFLGMILLLSALCGYAACIELVLTIVAGKLLLDLFRAQQTFGQMIKKYGYLAALILCVLLIYSGVIFVCKQYRLINVNMYNTQTLSVKEIIYKFTDNWQQPFKVLTTGVPYGSPGIIILTVICFVLAVSVWKKRKILGICALLTLVYVIFALAYISPYNVFFMFRVHSYSVPYFYAILCALVWIGGSKLYHNFLLLLMLGLICMFVRADLVVQKVWYLGNKQDAAAVERIKKDLLPEMISQKTYRLSTIGNLYGRQKFAEISFASEYEKDVYREYWGAPYFLSILFSSGFWAYEEKNPIWGDAIYLGQNIVYGTSNENLHREEELKAKIFAMNFGADKDKMIPVIKQLRAFPKKPYFFVGEKDIFLVLSDDARVKDILIFNIADSK